MGVISICSVQLVSKVGFLSLSTSTFRLLCSNGQENVSAGILCSQESKLRSLSLKSDCVSKLVNLIWSECFAPVAFCWQKSTQDSYNMPLMISSNRASDILKLIELKKKYNLNLIIMGAQEATLVSRQIADSKIPLVINPTGSLNSVDSSSVFISSCMSISL